MNALECGRGVGGDPLPRLDRPGEGDHVDPLVLDEGGAGLVAAGDHVEHAGRQELGGHLAQFERGDRRGRGGLEHDRVSGGERRTDLPHRHHQRVVPRRDLAHHTNRLTPDHRRVALGVLAR